MKNSGFKEVKCIVLKKKNQIKEKKVCDPLVFIVFDMLGE